MSIQNGKCPECGGVLLLDSSKEKVVCRNCGHEIIIEQALQKCIVDGIAPFETILLSAQQAIEFDEDYDKAAKKYREALNLQPNNHQAFWGLFLCEIESIKWGYSKKGFVQFPGDLHDCVIDAINRYAKRAYINAPEEIKPYYSKTIDTIKNIFLSI